VLQLSRRWRRLALHSELPVWAVLDAKRFQVRQRATLSQTHPPGTAGANTRGAG
jgi:hypothetical protein